MNLNNVKKQIIYVINALQDMNQVKIINAQTQKIVLNLIIGIALNAQKIIIQDQIIYALTLSIVYIQNIMNVLNAKKTIFMILMIKNVNIQN